MLTAARIGFLNTTLLVNESSGFATLYVAILGNTTLGREVVIRFSTADSSATGNHSHYYYSLIICSSVMAECYYFFTAGADYTSTEKILNFNRSITHYVVQVPIIQGGLPEPTEMFHAYLTLVHNNSDSVIVDPAIATVNITNYNGELGNF